MVNLICNIYRKCLILGLKNVFVSGLVYTYRFDVSLLERVHILILDFCRKHCFIYIDNRNIRSDDLHLIDKGKAFLADNFIVYLNSIF